MLLRAPLWKNLCRHAGTSYNTQCRSYGTVSLECLDNRSLLRVQGSDAASFLQGLITNDMNHFQHGASSIYAMLLNTTGRVLYDTMIYRISPQQPDQFLVECDSSLVGSLRKHLSMFRIRKKVDIEPIESRIWVAFGREAKIEFPHLEQTPSEGVSIFKDTRLHDLGYRIISDPNVTLDDVKASFPSGISFLEECSYLEHRLRLGIGEGAKNFPQGKCFPLESNCDYMHGVSFHKGCYIGQELTARTHHTGVVRKRLMPLRFEKPVPDNELPVDAEIKLLDGQVVGKLREVCNRVGIGLLRIEKVLPTQTLILADKFNCLTERPLWWPKEQTKKLQS